MWIDNVLSKLELEHELTGQPANGEAMPAEQPPATLTPSSHLYGVAGDEGLVAMYGAPAVGELLRLIDLVEQAYVRGDQQAEEAERDYWTTWRQVESARWAAIAL